MHACPSNLKNKENIIVLPKDCMLIKVSNPRGDCLHSKQSHILFK